MKKRFRCHSEFFGWPESGEMVLILKETVIKKGKQGNVQKALGNIVYGPLGTFGVGGTNNLYFPGMKKALKCV